MAATNQPHIFMRAHKFKIRNYSNFTIIFPKIWRCASDSFKVLLKFKMGPTDQLHNFLCAQKLKNLKSEINQILRSHSTRYEDVQVIFVKVLLNFKLAFIIKR